MKYVSWTMAGIAMLLSASLFGFFFAWICSTMWGLDRMDPRIAIEAMQAMNASVRNAVFAPVFFGTPIALLVTAVLIFAQGARAAAGAFGLSAVIAGLGGVALTMVVHVPLNEALAVVTVADDPAAAQQIWTDYSPTWQFWNVTRTVFCGLAFAVALVGIAQFARYSSASGLSAN